MCQKYCFTICFHKVLQSTSDTYSYLDCWKIKNIFSDHMLQSKGNPAKVYIPDYFYNRCLQDSPYYYSEKESGPLLRQTYHQLHFSIHCYLN